MLQFSRCAQQPVRRAFLGENIYLQIAVFSFHGIVQTYIRGVWVRCIEEHGEVPLCLFETMGGKRTTAPHHTDATHPSKMDKGKEKHPHVNHHKPSGHEHNHTAHAHEHKHTGHAHEHNKHHPHINILEMKTFLADMTAELINANENNRTGVVLWCDNVGEIIRIIGCPENAEHKMISGIFMAQYHKSKQTAYAAVKSCFEKAANTAEAEQVLVDFKQKQQDLSSYRAQIVRDHEMRQRAEREMNIG